MPHSGSWWDNSLSSGDQETAVLVPGWALGLGRGHRVPWFDKSKVPQMSQAKKGRVEIRS